MKDKFSKIPTYQTSLLHVFTDGSKVQTIINPLSFDKDLNHHPTLDLIIRSLVILYNIKLLDLALKLRSGSFA